MQWYCGSKQFVVLETHKELGQVPMTCYIHDGRVQAVSDSRCYDVPHGLIALASSARYTWCLANLSLTSMSTVLLKEYKCTQHCSVQLMQVNKHR
jgi:hypothetical protein